MRYEDAVAEGRRLIKRSEEDQWRLAELTWEQVEAGATRKQWARDIGVDPSYVGRLYRVWQRWGNEGLNRPKFTDAYAQYERASLEDAENASSLHYQEKAMSAVRNMPVEQKADVVHELLDEPEVAARVYSRARQVPEEKLREAYERVPEELRNESLGAPTGVSAYLSGIREYLRLIHEMATNPRVSWDGYRGAVAEELQRISRQAYGIAEIIADPKQAQVTDEDLERLLRDAR